MEHKAKRRTKNDFDERERMYESENVYRRPENIRVNYVRMCLCGKEWFEHEYTSFVSISDRIGASDITQLPVMFKWSTLRTCQKLVNSLQMQYFYSTLSFCFYLSFLPERQKVRSEATKQLQLKLAIKHENYRKSDENFPFVMLCSILSVYMTFLGMGKTRIEIISNRFNL